MADDKRQEANERLKRFRTMSLDDVAVEAAINQRLNVVPRWLCPCEGSIRVSIEVLSQPSQGPFTAKPQRLRLGDEWLRHRSKQPKLKKMRRCL